MLCSHDTIEVHHGGAGLGWHAPAYGSLLPTTTLRAALAGAKTPFALVTAFVETQVAPSLLWLTPAPAAGPVAEPIAFRIAADGWHDTVVAVGPERAAVDGTSFGIVGEGRLLWERAASASTAAPRPVAAAMR